MVLRVLDATQGKPENRALENALLGKKVVEVYNKSDLINNAKNEGNKIFVSAKTGDGIDELLKIVAKYFDEEKTSESEVLTSERQLSSVTTAREKVEEGLNALKGGVTTDCVISVLTEGYTALGEITGETVSEKSSTTYSINSAWVNNEKGLRRNCNRRGTRRHRSRACRGAHGQKHPSYDA